MKLLVLFSLVALVANDFVASEPEPPADSYNTPEKVDAAEDTAAPTPPGKPFFDFKNFYQGAFPPAPFPPSNFLSTASIPSFNYPLRTFNYTPFRQGILPPISQILPPQISQIVPPIFTNPRPSLPLPVPSPTLPPQSFPPQLLTSINKPLLNKFTFTQPRPLTRLPSTLSTTFPNTFPNTISNAFPNAFPNTIPNAFPSLFSYPPPNFFPLQAQPPTTHKESLPTAYGPPSAAPEDPEPSGPAETSAPFEPSPISYPYEPALPEEPEPAAPHKPAQEYGPPSSK